MKRTEKHIPDRKRILAGFVAACMAVLFLAGAPLPAVYAAEEGYWYMDEFNLEEIHAEGITGEGVKIADVDTMINLQLPWLADAKVILQEESVTKYYGDIGPETDDFSIAVHATDMVSLLQGNGEGATMGSAPIGIAPGATIYHYAAVHDVEDDSLTGGDLFEEAVRFALEDDVDIIMIPAGGLSYYDRQYPVFLEAIRRGIPIVIAHDNSRYRIDQNTNPEVYEDGQGGDLLFEELPTASFTDEICYWPGLVTVQALDSHFLVQVLSRTEDSGTDISAPGEDIWMQREDWGYFEPLGGGCSAGTASAAGFLALAMQKWPEATGNQILQLMARTPEWQRAEAAEEASFDVLNLEISPFYGWGGIDVRAMIETDPTGFPDVNPVLYKDIASIVKNAEIRGDTEVLKRQELIDVAQVLDEQLEREGMDRPLFLKKVLGNDRSEPIPSGTGQSASGEGGTEADGTQITPGTAGTDTAPSPGSAGGTAKTDTGVPASDGARGGAIAPVLGIVCPLALAAVVVYDIRRRKKGKAPDKKKKTKPETQE